MRAGGKRLRPLLVLTCGAIEDADEQHAAALISAGAAVELIHMATLVHDDVLDDAALRRGKPTVYAEHGRDAAIQTGDMLFAIAFEELARSGDADQVRALSDASSGLARGELLQREDAWDATVTRERYLLRCTLKTARLFEAAAQLGAYAGGRAELAEHVRRVRRQGRPRLPARRRRPRRRRAPPNSSARPAAPTCSTAPSTCR